MIEKEGHCFLNLKEYKKWKEEEMNVKLCKSGISAEHEGDIEKAIQIYEELLKKKFEGTHPYRSLCEIYHKHGRFCDEIRVIESLKKVTPKERYKTEKKYLFFDERYKELKK